MNTHRSINSETHEISDQFDQPDRSEHENRAKMVAYLIILFMLFLVGASCCDPNSPLPPKATPIKGHA